MSITTYRVGGVLKNKIKIELGLKHRGLSKLVKPVLCDFPREQ